MYRVTIDIDYPETPEDEIQLAEMFMTQVAFFEGFHVTCKSEKLWDNSKDREKNAPLSEVRQ